MGVVAPMVCVWGRFHTWGLGGKRFRMSGGSGAASRAAAKSSRFVASGAHWRRVHFVTQAQYRSRMSTIAGNHVIT